ncbi:hypothetical protein XELAEV_18035335mg [Xenopus laevis]|uniref:Uncharacterized protein n=1 Tax=Xenopus laevis TaxID=8355 RepID=A0A974CG30_XENLA|nr:hypothetical protein XELAEV_18035334mg [Xenopus laevis]OCT72358.1 hypothetical protein XELAEV_18035335mg [Xenopus laevis]
MLLSVFIVRYKKRLYRQRGGYVAPVSLRLKLCGFKWKSTNFMDIKIDIKLRRYISCNTTKYKVQSSYAVLIEQSSSRNRCIGA